MRRKSIPVFEDAASGQEYVEHLLKHLWGGSRGLGASRGGHNRECAATEGDLCHWQKRKKR